jgi:hypothetical protein
MTNNDLHLILKKVFEPEYKIESFVNYGSAMNLTSTLPKDTDHSLFFVVIDDDEKFIKIENYDEVCEITFNCWSNNPILMTNIPDDIETFLYILKIKIKEYKNLQIIQNQLYSVLYSLKANPNKIIRDYKLNNLILNE